MIVNDVRSFNCVSCARAIVAEVLTVAFAEDTIFLPARGLNKALGTESERYQTFETGPLHEYSVVADRSINGLSCLPHEVSPSRCDSLLSCWQGSRLHCQLSGTTFMPGRLAS